MYALKHGFQHLWRTIVQQEKLLIDYNVNIQWLHRPNKHHQSTIIGARMSDGTFRRLDFDFVIWSADMKSSAKYWLDYIPKEQELLTRTNHVFFTTAIMDSRNVPRPLTPIDYFFSNMLLKRRHSIWAQRDSYALVKGYQGADYQDEAHPTGNDGRDVRTTVVGGADPTLFEGDMRERFMDHFREMGGTDIKIFNLTTWNYFPHFSPSDMEDGVLWRILEMQGQYGMWYIGSSVCFESIKSVVEYNKMLVHNMELVK